MDQRRKLTDIAAAIGISVPMVSYLMSGKRSVSWAMAQRLSAVFGRAPSWWMKSDAAKIARVLKSGKLVGGEGAANGNRRAA